MRTGPDEEIRVHADTIDHRAGNCRIAGAGAPPFDPNLRERGVERPSVPDASVMPGLLSASVKAASAMIAEETVDLT